MGFSIEEINESEISVQSQKFVIKNQFEPVHTVGGHKSENIELKKVMVLQNHNFLPFHAKITFNTTKLKI